MTHQPQDGHNSPAAEPLPGSAPPAASAPSKQLPPPPPPPAAETPAAFPSSLDPTETSVEANYVKRFLAESPPIPEEPPAPTGPELDADQIFRHSGWAPERRRVRAALFRTGQSGRRVQAFDECGRSAWVWEDENSPGSFRVTCDRCHDRLCTPCARERSWKIKAALAAQMADKPHSFITLTLSGKGEPLTELIDRLYRSFRYLRAHPLWESRVAGGAAFLEVKWNDKASRWHPHLHIICEAKFVVQAELSNAWRSITKDSFVVDVRRVSATAGQVRYVTKYASKPLNTSFSGVPDRMDEAVIALKGRRLCLCFGAWYGTRLSEAEESDLEDEIDSAYRWRNIGSLHELFARANAGEHFAALALAGIGQSRWRRDAAGEDSS